jgi:anti-sigma factor RsiW
MSGEVLSSEEARARFDAALDGELPPEERASFEAALAQDAELRADYERLREVLAATRELAGDVPEVDLLASVQHKLRARSGGRFYRDRFSERRGVQPSLSLLLGVSALFIVATACWFAYGAGWFEALGAAGR